VPFPGQGPGLPGLKDVLREMRMAFPDMHWTIEEQIAEADKVLTRFTWTGTHSAAFLGVPATGKPVTVCDRPLGERQGQGNANSDGRSRNDETDGLVAFRPGSSLRHASCAYTKSRARAKWNELQISEPHSNNSVTPTVPAGR
jgi:hypothetical protein